SERYVSPAGSALKPAGVNPALTGGEDGARVGVGSATGMASRSQIRTTSSSLSVMQASRELARSEVKACPVSPRARGYDG
ncbi:hypothetical protein ABTB07_22140, partial [Acinetobacter baumannii]